MLLLTNINLICSSPLRFFKNMFSGSSISLSIAWSNWKSLCLFLTLFQRLLLPLFSFPFNYTQLTFEEIRVADLLCS